MISTDNGITTSLGQISELSDYEFLKDLLNDGTSIVGVESKESIYAANFLRDANTDLLNGDVLRGNYIVIELTTVDNSVLNLFSINVMSKYSPVGAR